MEYSEYVVAKGGATVIADGGDFDIMNGEFNPKFVQYYFDNYLEVGNYAWEPFASHESVNNTSDLAVASGIKLYAFNIDPSDSRVDKNDSTRFVPPHQVLKCRHRPFGA